MSEDFGNDFITVTDEEGREYTLEHLATTEINDILYMAFLPADIDEDDDEYGLILFKVVEEDGEQLFEQLEDDGEISLVHNTFIELLSEDDEFLTEETI
jgi:uncharacterized protein YrzB (UPF0473 family)